MTGIIRLSQARHTKDSAAEAGVRKILLTMA